MALVHHAVCCAAAPYTLAVHLQVQQDAGSKAKDGEDDADPQEFYEQRLLKPLPVSIVDQTAAP